MSVGGEKGDGFPGQRIVVLPRGVVAEALQQPILRELLPTDVGYFPQADGHCRHRPHGAPQAILILCLKGGGWAELDGVRHVVRAGQLLAIPAETPHSYGAAADPPWTIPWLHAAGASVPDFLRELGTSVQRPVVGVGDDARVGELFREILDLLAGGYGRTLLVQASQALGYLLARLARCAHEPQPGVLGPRERMLQALHYMRHHLDHPLRVADLAALARLSPSHFSTLFRQKTGYSVIDYFLRLRVHRACQLLDTTDLPVKDIAARVGFTDALYFSKVFKAVLGTPPSNYRAQHKG